MRENPLKFRKNKIQDADNFSFGVSSLLDQFQTQTAKLAQSINVFIERILQIFSIEV